MAHPVVRLPFECDRHRLMPAGERKERWPHVPQVSVDTVIDGDVFTILEGVLPADRLSDPSWRTTADQSSPKRRC